MKHEGRSGLVKAAISFRIGPAQWMSEVRFSLLLDMFEKSAGVADELTFFTSDTHAPQPLDVVSARARLMTGRLTQARSRGYRAGINVLATIGHHNENLPNSLPADYTRMTDIDGNVCMGSLCPNDEKVHAYISQLYKILASTNPDYIWIDDDIRLFGHMPIACGCFCDTCLLRFAGESGMRYTRESLKQAFNLGDIDDRLRVRRAWLQHNRVTIYGLLKLIEETVHGVKADMPLGFMTGDRFFEGYDFDNWAIALSGPGSAQVIWRPGGGFYSDECMKDLAAKSHEIGRQVSLLPDSVTSIQSEIENFPYQLMKKSKHTTALEAASHMAAGCTGAAFNVLSMYDEPLDEYGPLLEKLKGMRPFYDLIVNSIGRHKPKGLHTGWEKDSFAASNAGGPDWFAGNIGEIAWRHAQEILENGIPAAYSPDSASVVVLTGDSVLAMKEEEILRIFSSGVYMDARSLIRISDLGYSELAGFRTECFLQEDCIEEFAEHPLNAGFVGCKRDARQSFLWWTQSAAMLSPVCSGTETLARLVDYDGKEKAPCGMGIFQNSLGGRVCVAGYYPWSFLQNLSKSSQIKAVMRWLSKDTLPAYVESFHKVSLWARETSEQRTVLALINSCLDPAEGLTILMRTEAEEIAVFDMHCAEAKIRSLETNGPYKKFTIPAIQGWDMRLIVAG